MIHNNIYYSPFMWLLRRSWGALFSLFLYMSVNAQEMPPRPITVTVNTAQNLCFGIFAQGTIGGTVSVSSSGMRSSTGDIILISGGIVSTARFDVVANRGTIITIVNGSDVQLTSGSGGHLTLHVGNSNPVSPFIITVDRPTVTPVYIGGTLTVGIPGSNPPGDYSGTFDITFVQQ
jgi:hypothetical protein